jgi:hypothetical protein
MSSEIEKSTAADRFGEHIRTGIERLVELASNRESAGSGRC